MKRILCSALLAGMAAAVSPARRPLPEVVPSARQAEIVCDTARDGEPFCLVFYPTGGYCTTYHRGYQEGASCGD